MSKITKICVSNMLFHALICNTKIADILGLQIFISVKKSISSSCYWNAPDLDLLSLELEVWNMNRSAPTCTLSSNTSHPACNWITSHLIEGFYIHFGECQYSSSYTPLKLTVGNQWKLDIIYVGCNLKSRIWTKCILEAHTCDLFVFLSSWTNSSCWHRSVSLILGIFPGF